MFLEFWFIWELKIANQIIFLLVLCAFYIEPTAFYYDINSVQSPRLNEPGITSHVGLNRFQTRFILENIYNDDILSTLGREDDEDKIYGVFLMGDMNNGQLYPRCEWTNDNGDVNADNCDPESPDDQPLNPFDLFAEYEFIDGPDIKYKAYANEGVQCTSCWNTTRDDFNVLAVMEEDGVYISNQSVDIDHVLVQNGYCKNFKSVKFERDFMDKIVEIDGELFPASDHYAPTLDIEFKKNKGGGRCNMCKCTKSGKNTKHRRRKHRDNYRN